MSQRWLRFFFLLILLSPLAAEARALDWCRAVLVQARIISNGASAIQENSAIQSVPPEGAWMIALGIGNSDALSAVKSKLVQFSRRQAKDLDRNVAVFSEFSETGYIGYYRMWNHSPLDSSEKVAETVQGAVRAHPQTKVILFKLDDFEPRKLFREDGGIAYTFTNFEVRLLTENAEYFAATRWFLEGKELNYAELAKFFGNYVQLPADPEARP